MYSEHLQTQSSLFGNKPGPGVTPSALIRVILKSLSRHLRNNPARRTHCFPPQAHRPACPSPHTNHPYELLDFMAHLMAIKPGLAFFEQYGNPRQAWNTHIPSRSRSRDEALCASDDHAAITLRASSHPYNSSSSSCATISRTLLFDSTGRPCTTTTKPF